MCKHVSRLFLPVVVFALTTFCCSQDSQVQVNVLMRPATASDISASRATGLQAAAPVSDSFTQFVRFPSEINNRFFQPQNGFAYYRDFFTGGETLDTGVDGESISAVMITADNPPQTLQFNPITFHANLNGQQDCWVGFAQTICNAPVLDVTWFVQTQCFTAGTFTMAFSHQGAEFFRGTYTITPTIPAHTVPGDNSDPVPNAPAISYNQGDYPTTQYGDFCSFQVTNSQGRTSTVVRHCDPVNHPTEKTMFIKQLGCALTSATMVLGYFGLFTDPVTLNTYLTQNHGYDDAGGVNWPVVVRYANANGLGVSFARTNNNGNAARNATCAKGPTIIPVQHTVPNDPTHRLHGHFVTVWGQDGDPQNTYLLKDPNGGIGDRLDGTTPPRDYNNRYTGTREFQGPDQNFNIPTFEGVLSVKIHSPAELLITNSAGQRTGFDPATNTSFTEIPNAVYAQDLITDVTDSSPEPAESDSKVLDLGAAAADTYTVTVTGTDFGTYTLEFSSIDPNFQEALNILRDVPTSPGQVQTFTFTTPIVSGQPFPLSGGFNGGGQRPRDVNRFLTYGNPSSGKTSLGAGTTTFPLMVFYDPSVIPSSFSAVLNGTNVSTLFNPTPGGFEVVNIPVVSGSNVIKLSIDGNLGTRVATDTDRLVFDVP